MCHYITLTTDCPDVVALAAAMARNGRNAKPQSNPSIHRLIQKGERQYLTSGVCDCGTVLGQGAERATPDDISKVVARKKKSAWSKAKIDRWLADRGRAHARPGQQLDSFELWANIVADVLKLPNTSTAGLVVHFYDGQVDEETFTLNRREVRAGTDVSLALKQLREDELLIVHRSPKGAG